MIRRRTRFNEAQNIVAQIEHDRRVSAMPRSSHRCLSAVLITALSSGDLHVYDMHSTRNKKHLTLALSPRPPLLADTIMEGSPPQELKPLPPPPPPATSTLNFVVLWLWSTPTTNVKAAKVMNGVRVVPSTGVDRWGSCCVEIMPLLLSRLPGFICPHNPPLTVPFPPFAMFPILFFSSSRLPFTTPSSPSHYFYSRTLSLMLSTCFLVSRPPSPSSLFHFSCDLVLPFTVTLSQFLSYPLLFFSRFFSYCCYLPLRQLFSDTHLVLSACLQLLINLPSTLFQYTSFCTFCYYSSP